MRVRYEGRREADARNRFSIPARTTMVLDAHYRFKMGKSDPMVIRANLASATNVFVCRVTSGGGFRTQIPHRASVALTVDF
ncbi:hypothetical protein EOE18_17480 [Novosphingobium umbonatum]|uniref:TonB-dependent receptor n=1 Tax=Novosphingobium umbonatum TaxID=1908524 RepID=A0A437MX90_9SPHN|nr:hypothetical protein [Novosphingobium umbonatum]RVU02257.1 hypothetical protein EOE18_17480 [Novosphingobium umbonatum]